MTIVAVYNMKGGVGKTTCAVNLAYFCAASGRKTLLWDLDAQAAATFALRIKPEVAQFGKRSLRNARTFIEAIRETDHGNLDLLPADFAYHKLDRYLEHLDHPKRALKEILARVGSEYDLILLDCPAGFSLLSEAVIAASDALLVPTIPSTLSLRTLQQLARSLDHLQSTPALLPFLSMVDRRKALHRSLAQWASRHPELFLSKQIPYASSVEQMSVRRAPVAIYDASDPAAKAFANLWLELRSHLDQLANSGNVPLSTPSTYADTIETLLTTLIYEAQAQSAATASAHRKDQSADQSDDGPQFVFELDGKHEMQALEHALARSGARRSADFLAHTFDTPEGTLRRLGYCVQLVEEPGRFLLSVTKSARTQGEMLVAPGERHSAKIDAAWAAQLLSGRLSALSVIHRRMRHRVAEEVNAQAGGRALQRVESSEHDCLRYGPVELVDHDAAIAVEFEFDRAERSSNATTYQVCVRPQSADTQALGRLLRAWFDRAGVRWRPESATAVQSSSHDTTRAPSQTSEAAS